MRKLSMKQKKLIASAKHFTPELMRSLEKENDYETLYQDRYIFPACTSCKRNSFSSEPGVCQPEACRLKDF